MRLCVCVPVAQFSPAQVYVGYIMPRYRMRKWENTHMESMFQHKVFYFLLSLCDALAIRGQMPERSKRYLLTIFLSNYINLLINFSFFTYCAAYSFFFFFGIRFVFCMNLDSTERLWLLLGRPPAFFFRTAHCSWMCARSIDRHSNVLCASAVNRGAVGNISGREMELDMLNNTNNVEWAIFACAER